MKKGISIFYIAVSISCTASAQSIGPSSTNTTGSSVTLPDGIIIEQAIGQVVAGNTFQSASLIVTQDVLQPDFGNKNALNIPGKASLLSVYPNPANQFISIQPGFSTESVLECTLTDALGRIVIRQNINLATGNERSEIALESLAAGLYILNVNCIQKGNTTVSYPFKIQKI